MAGAAMPLGLGVESRSPILLSASGDLKPDLPLLLLATRAASKGPSSTHPARPLTVS